MSITSTNVSMFETVLLAVIPGLTRNPGTYRKETGFQIGTLGNDE